MKQDNAIRLFVCASAIGMVFLAGCAVLPQATDSGANIVDITAPSDALDTTDVAEEETPADWSDVKPSLYAPDPEYTALSASDEANDQELLDDVDNFSRSVPADTDTPEALLETTEVEQSVPPAQESVTVVDNPILAPVIWDRIRAGFKMRGRNHPRVAADKKWFAKHQAYLDRALERAEPYLHHITEEIARRGMPMELALLPIVESAFQPFAYSGSRASGLWQFIPGTAQQYGLKLNWWYDGRRDLYASTDAALTYLQALADMFDGDWLLALAAYNSGEGKVGREIARNRRLGKPTDYWSLSLPRETRGYVPKLLAIVDIVANPTRHDVTLRYIPDAPYLTEIDTGAQIDLLLAAELTGMPVEDVLRLNPGFNRWASDPDGPHRLLVPIAQAEEIKQKLAALGPEKRIRWERHVVRKGETLDRIAQRYQTTAEVLQQANRLTNKSVRAKHPLIIPIAQQSLTIASVTDAGTGNDQEGRKLEHTVRHGDTLWDIAKKYGVSIKNILQWNASAIKGILKSGQRLVIWLTPKTKIIQQEPSSSPISQITDYRQRIYYTVRSGDSLSRIAERFDVELSELQAWNEKSLHSKKQLQAGQRLTLFVDTTVADKI